MDESNVAEGSGAGQDREEILNQFKMVTSITDDDEARTYLDLFDYNLESAIAGALASGVGDQDNRPTRRDAGYGGAVGGEDYANVRPFDNVAGRQRVAGARTGNNNNNNTTFVSRLLGTLLSPVTYILSMFSVFLPVSVRTFVTSLVPYSAGGADDPAAPTIRRSYPPGAGSEPSNNAIDEVTALEREIETQFNAPTHPGFFQGSYNDAMAHAQREFKALLVYVHARDHEDTESFCRSTLASAPLARYIDDNLIFWAGSVQTRQGFAVAEALGSEGFPYLGVLAPISGRMRPIAAMVGMRAAGDVQERVEAALAGVQGAMRRAQRERKERNMAQQLRDEQDYEYQMSLAADREKERLREEEAKREREEKEAQAQREREEAEREQRRIEEEREEELKRQRESEAKRMELPEEPAVGTEGVTTIMVKLPNGDRLKRRFLKTDPVSLVYDFVASQENLEWAHFALRTNFPPRTVERESGESLETAELCPQAMLLLQDLDA